jgi:3'-5' exoribonuclease
MTDASGITRLPAGSQVEGTCLVGAFEHRSFGDGKQCVVLTLSDAGGRIDTAPFWSGRQHLIAGIGKGMVVHVVGEIQTYRGRRQLEVTRIAPAREPVDHATLLPSAGDPMLRWARLDQWRAAIRGPRLAAVVSLFYDDAGFRRRYGQCPASTVGHHAAIGGLLQHTCEVAEIGMAIAEVAGADQDLVLAGALLHDIGKLEAYRWASAFELSEPGALVGHVALGLMMLSGRVAAASTPPCTNTELLLLLHLVASHHGRLEFGAAAPPMTLEAEVLHYADDASAKSADMAQAVADIDNFDAGAHLSTRTLWQLDHRRVYRGASDWGGQKKERPPSRG